MEIDREVNTTYNYCFEDKFQEEDLENRRLYLNGEVAENAIDNIVYHILRYNRLDKGIPIKDRKPIVLYINSPGGNVPEGWSVIDTIQSSETPIYTVNLAMCASMSFLIYLSGQKRYAMPHSEFLMHDGSIMGFDSAAKMKDRIEFETIQIEKVTKDYIMNRTKINEELYNEKYRIEWYFLPDEGKSIGAVDYIVGKDCSINDIL